MEPFRVNLVGIFITVYEWACDTVVFLFMHAESLKFCARNRQSYKFTSGCFL